MYAQSSWDMSRHPGLDLLSLQFGMACVVYNSRVYEPSVCVRKIPHAACARGAQEVGSDYLTTMFVEAWPACPMPTRADLVTADGHVTAALLGSRTWLVLAALQNLRCGETSGETACGGVMRHT